MVFGIYELCELILLEVTEIVSADDREFVWLGVRTDGGE